MGAIDIVGNSLEPGDRVKYIITGTKSPFSGIVETWVVETTITDIEQYTDIGQYEETNDLYYYVATLAKIDHEGEVIKMPANALVKIGPFKTRQKYSDELRGAFDSTNRLI